LELLQIVVIDVPSHSKKAKFAEGRLLADFLLPSALVP
jgi:hypothetical protein